MLLLKHFKFVTVLINFVLRNKGDLTKTYECQKPNLEIMVSPKGKHIQVRWEIEIFKHGDMIELYKSMYNSKDNVTNKEITKFNVTSNKGWKTSSKKFEETIPEIYHKPVHLAYGAVYWRKHKKRDLYIAVVETELRTYPNWMTYYWRIIKDRPINSIFIPGTHDSVCNEKITLPCMFKSNNFKKTVESSILNTASNVKFIGGISMTQDTTILEQLLLGVRYLDIRVYYFNKIYWAAHGQVKVIELDKVIDQIVKFVINTKNEIVLFDVHQIVERSIQDHMAFKDFLSSKFTVNGKKLYIPNDDNCTWTSTLQNIINNQNEGKVIISYVKNSVVQNNHDVYWPSVQHLWGNKTKVDELIKYFRMKFGPNYDEIDLSKCYSAMAQMTPVIKSLKNEKSMKGKIEIIEENAIMLNKLVFLGGLRGDAKTNAEAIHDLFMEKEIGLKTNILSTNYFMGMGTVRQAFLWNERQIDANDRKECDPPEFYDDKYYQNNITPLLV